MIITHTGLLKLRQIKYYSHKTKLQDSVHRTQCKREINSQTYT